MSYFSGCCIILVKFIFFFFMMVFLQTSMAFDETEDGINPFFEFSSREEIVRLAGYGEEKLSTVLITGTVLCEACLDDGTPLRSFPVSGALVGINCGEWSTQSSAQVITNGYGEFQIDLPSNLHAIPKLEKTCSVEVVKIPNDSTCKVAFGREPKSLTLLVAREGVRIYTAGEVKLSLFKERAK